MGSRKGNRGRAAVPALILLSLLPVPPRTGQDAVLRRHSRPVRVSGPDGIGRAPHGRPGSGRNIQEVENRMNRRRYELILILLTLANGGLFFLASRSALERGIGGADSREGLPSLLQVAAAAAVLLLSVAVHLTGRRIPEDRVIYPERLFQVMGLSGTQMAGKIVLFGATALLMLFGYGLFRQEGMLAALYALTGGILVLLLYVWFRTVLSRSSG